MYGLLHFQFLRNWMNGAGARFTRLDVSDEVASVGGAQHNLTG